MLPLFSKNKPSIIVHVDTKINIVKINIEVCSIERECSNFTGFTFEKIKTLVLVVLFLMTIIYNNEILHLSNPEVQWLTSPL